MEPGLIPQAARSGDFVGHSDTPTRAGFAWTIVAATALHSWAHSGTRAQVSRGIVQAFVAVRH